MNPVTQAPIYYDSDDSSIPYSDIFCMFVNPTLIKQLPTFLSSEMYLLFQYHRQV